MRTISPWTGVVPADAIQVGVSGTVATIYQIGDTVPARPAAVASPIGSSPYPPLLRAAAMRSDSPFPLRRPLLAAKPMPSSVTVSFGDIYSNGGSTWFTQSPGTTGASPSPTVGSNLSDSVTAGGTAAFVYLGKTIPVIADGDVDIPTAVAEIRPGDLTGMREINAVTAPGFFTFTATPAPVARAYSLALPGTYRGDSSWFGAVDTPALIGYKPSVARRHGFVTRSKRVFVYGPGNYAPQQYFFEVNGKPLFEYGCWNSTGTLSAGPAGLLITFPDARPREIWVGMPYTGDFVSVYVDTNESIAPASASPLTMVCEGDSLTDGGNSAPYYWRGDWPSQLADSMGIQNVWNTAVGGTGFKNGGANATPYTHPNRLAIIIAANPAVILVGGSHNDGGYTSAERKAEMTSWYQSIRTALPKTLIVMYGSSRLRTETLVTTSAIDADIATVVNTARAAGDLNIWFIPTLTNSEPWVLDSVSASPYFTSTGDAHPSQHGMTYLAQQYIASFRNWIRTLPF